MPNDSLRNTSISIMIVKGSSNIQINIELTVPSDSADYNKIFLAWMPEHKRLLENKKGIRENCVIVHINMPKES